MYVAAYQRPGVVEILGQVKAPDVLTATLRARVTWPACSVMPWRAYKQLRRAQLALGLEQSKEMSR